MFFILESDRSPKLTRNFRGPTNILSIQMLEERPLGTARPLVKAMKIALLGHVVRVLLIAPFPIEIKIADWYFVLKL
jgi:hypothetical protein